MREDERQLRAYYEAEADQRRRPQRGDARRRLAERFADRLRDDGRRLLIDVGAGPGSDHTTFSDRHVSCVGVDLAVGNARAAAERGHTVLPASLFALPFADETFPAGWSMSTLQHVGDDRIDDALAEFVRVLVPGAPVVIGVWGGRDEVRTPVSSKTGIDLPRTFVLRSHDRTRRILRRHLVIEHDEVWSPGSADGEYLVAFARAPSPHGNASA